MDLDEIGNIIILEGHEAPVMCLQFCGNLLVRTDQSLYSTPTILLRSLMSEKTNVTIIVVIIIVVVIIIIVIIVIIIVIIIIIVVIIIYCYCYLFYRLLQVVMEQSEFGHSKRK